jgi:hypothetical protein
MCSGLPPVEAFDGVTCITGRYSSAPQSWPMEESMAITWRKDIDKALDDARAQKRHLLLDFSAAPM